MSVLEDINARSRRAVAKRAALLPLRELQARLAVDQLGDQRFASSDTSGVVSEEQPDPEATRDKSLGDGIDISKTTPATKSQTRSLAAALRRGEGPRVIAEHKRASPSEGNYACPAALADVIRGYTAAGAVALSILTEEERFGGSLQHLQEARALTNLPLLRKDFIVDEYQLYEAKLAGADAVLLIAAGLSIDEAISFCRKAHELGLEVLLELHEVTELDYLSIGPDVVGINNRDLRTLKIDLRTSEALLFQLPTDLPRISESGIQSPEDAARMLRIGYEGLLIGTRFMKSSDPGAALNTFLHDTRAAL